MPAQDLRVNLGGEGEVPGVINQQGPWVVLDPNWFSSRAGRPFAALVADGHVFLIAPNDALPFPDGSVDEVITNSVPLDTVTPLGPGVQSSEIRRILKPGGCWIMDTQLKYVKP